MDNGVYTFYQDLEAEIAVAKDKVTMVNDAIAAIQALSLSGQDKAKAANALKYLENVRIRTITTSGDVEANIADLLKAIESLNAITDADTFDIRLAIDDLLKTWEGAWYLE
jgi:flagellar biosynthesis regulator FlaF